VPLSPLQFPDLLKGVINQFQAFLADRENAEIIKGDQEELGKILILVADLDGDFNYHLKYQTQLRVFTEWYHSKYSSMLSEVSRKSTTHLNVLYAMKRERGYGEWDAKRMVETDKDWLEMIHHQGRLERVVSILKSLVDVCKDRLVVLQAISNNYRAEVRGDQSII